MMAVKGSMVSVLVIAMAATAVVAETEMGNGNLVAEIVQRQLKEYGLPSFDCDVLTVEGYASVPNVEMRSSLHADRQFFDNWPKAKVATVSSTCLVTVMGGVPKSEDMSNVLDSMLWTTLEPQGCSSSVLPMAWAKIPFGTAQPMSLGL